MMVNTNLGPPPPPLIPKFSKQLKLLDIEPLELARQLTILESQLYRRIKPMECLLRSREQRSENVDNITRVIQTSNRVKLSIFYFKFKNFSCHRIIDCRLGSGICFEQERFSSTSTDYETLDQCCRCEFFKKWPGFISSNCILALSNFEQFLDHDRNHVRSKYTPHPAIKANMGASQSTDNGTVWSL